MQINKALVSGDFFRVMPIGVFKGIEDNKIVIEDRDLKCGLAIERKLKNGNYIVVAFIEPNEDSTELKFRDVDFRSVDYLDATKPLMIEEYKNCVDFARHALKDILEVK